MLVALSRCLAVLAPTAAQWCSHIDCIHLAVKCIKTNLRSNHRCPVCNGTHETIGIRAEKNGEVKHIPLDDVQELQIIEVYSKQFRNCSRRHGAGPTEMHISLYLKHSVVQDEEYNGSFDEGYDTASTDLSSCPSSEVEVSYDCPEHQNDGEMLLLIIASAAFRLWHIP